jgi:hypothetical protein
VVVNNINEKIIVGLNSISKSIVMKMFLTLSLLFISLFGQSEELDCLSFIKSNANSKSIHLHQPCLDLAIKGDAAAQYAVGMSYGYSGEGEREQKFYYLSANQNFHPAYLALAHAYNDSNPWTAIYWYQKFYDTRQDASGYAAKMISNIFVRLGEFEQSKYWVEQCGKTKYTGCSG